MTDAPPQSDHPVPTAPLTLGDFIGAGATQLATGHADKRLHELAKVFAEAMAKTTAPADLLATSELDTGLIAHHPQHR
ncbi:hypothetical protein RBA41_06300 [Massilia sp. CCM 9210]|uniref:hypothetical protein n=1 Tax=Massilia scottii TaxID=3057166 RepID=UPI002796B4F4|nr:hypothetical protein [Massilia sp. CCM 9210]MDQ1812912.1 hypothetical protein [Massilia sp. CCM 9210]